MLQKLAAESPDGLIRMLYYSKTALKGADLAREYADILVTSRRNNSRVGITGTLMVSGDRFAQILEGPAAAVLTLYERINLDPRHRFATILKVGPTPDRVFGTWAMAMAASRVGESVPLSASTLLNGAIDNQTGAADTLSALLLKLVQTSETPQLD